MRSRIIGMTSLVLTTSALTAWLCLGPIAADAQQRAARLKVEQLMNQDLPDLGDRSIQILRLTLPPGASSSAHAHPANVAVYVTQGTIVSAMDGGEEIAYEAGDLWYEAPNTPHTSFKNTSDTESAEAIAFFVIEKGKPNTTLPGAGHDHD